MVRLVLRLLGICTRMFTRMSWGNCIQRRRYSQVGERVMKPDVAFVSTDRLDVDEDEKFPIPPDLAIEVVSPTDVHYRIVRKAFDYLEAGTRLVWVLDPVAKTVTVYRSKSDIELLTSEATLTGEDVVPGFTCPVENLFE